MIVIQPLNTFMVDDNDHIPNALDAPLYVTIP